MEGDSGVGGQRGVVIDYLVQFFGRPAATVKYNFLYDNILFFFQQKHYNFQHNNYNFVTVIYDGNTISSQWGTAGYGKGGAEEQTNIVIESAAKSHNTTTA